MLAKREWQGTEPAATVSPLNGRGGDGGVDVGVSFADGSLNIYQLKYFPEGMSGGFGKRRNQVRDSWSSIKNRADLIEWILVVPCELTAKEYEFVRGLDNPQNIEIRVWALADLDQRLALHPDIARYAERTEAFLNDARVLDQEKAQLLEPIANLHERVSRLGQLGAEANPNWAFDFESKNGQPIVHLRPKSPEAAQEDPITLSVRGITERGSETLEQIERVIGFGVDEGLHIEKGLQEVVLTGPSFLPPSSGAESFTMQPVTSIPEGLVGTPVSLLLVDENGSRIGTHVGITEHFGNGFKGFSWRIYCYLSLRVTLFGSFDPEVEVPDFGVVMDSGGANASNFRDSIRFLLDISRTRKILVVVAGKPAGTWVSPGLQVGSVEDMQELIDFAEDLIAIEALANTRFIFPDSISQRDPVLARMVRSLLEGCVTAVPMIVGGTEVVATHAVEQFITLSNAGSKDFRLSMSDFRVNLFGVDISIGSVEMWHPFVQTEVSASAENSEESLVTLTPPAGQCFIFMPVRKLQNADRDIDILWPVPGESSPSWLVDIVNDRLSSGNEKETSNG
jgi:hypothetical protein